VRHHSATSNRAQAGRLGSCLLALTLATLGLVMLFGAGTAPAVVIRPEIATFGADGTSGSLLEKSGPTALDRNADRLFVGADGPTPGIFGFDASGSFPLPVLSGLSPIPAPAPEPGQSPGLAIDNTALPSAGNIYYAADNSGAISYVYGFDKTGAPLGGNFPINPRISPGTPDPGKIALAGTICEPAVDSAGNLWVANYGLARLLKYNSAGVFQTSISTSGQDVFPCNIAFDSNDDLYVGSGARPTWKYTAASGYSSATEFDSGRAVAIAVDPATHHVFIAHQGGDISEFDGDGAVVSRFAIEVPEVSPKISNLAVKGLAFDGEHDRLYASDAGNARVRVFGAGLTYPDLSLGVASGVDNTSANVAGTLSAQGLALSDCRFEYVTEAAFGASGFSDLSTGGSAPCSPVAGSIPADSATHPVGGTLTGLARSTSYRYRLLASNVNGSIATFSDSFETFGPALAETTGSPVRTMTSARLDSRVSPSRAATTYHFEYGTQGPCDANPCISTEPHSAGSGNQFVLVSQLIQGLEPGTTYHYRVIADNGNPDGRAVGEDMTLETFGDEVPLSHGPLPGPTGSDRAWELVSAPDTGGNPVGVLFAPGAAAISDSGNRAIYGVAGGTPLSESGTAGTRLFAERTPSGWQTKKILPSREEAQGPSWKDPGGPSDLSALVMENDYGGKFGDFSIWRLRPDTSPEKLYGPSDSGIRGAGKGFGLLLVSDDASRALIAMQGPQDPDHPAAPGTNNLYDVSSGPPRLISLMPDDTPPACGVIESTNGGPGISVAPARSTHWVSADGAFAFFPSEGNNCGGPQRLYLRDIEAETTTLLSASTFSGPECDAYLIKSTPDAAFFYTQSRLTAEDVEPEACAGSFGEGGDVYRYDLGDGSLDCATCLAGFGAGIIFSTTASDTGRQIGIADDGSRIYFTSRNRLLPGAPKSGGTYRLLNGDLAYVGSFGFVGDFGGSELKSGDGSVVVFRSESQTLNAQGGQQNGGTLQYYRYDDLDHSLVCLSCPAGGSLPRGGVGDLLGRPQPGANIRLMSENGENIAFGTPTPLVPADQNTAGAGQNSEAGTDIYEWRAGKLMLVSDGLINWPGDEFPKIRGITPSGHDIFFTAATQYTPDALDGYSRLYDARIGGGFEFPVPPKPCSLEVCQGTPKGTPEEAPPGTTSFRGPDNVAKPARTVCAKPKRKVRRGGKTRCVKPIRKKHSRQRANHHRRAGR